LKILRFVLPAALLAGTAAPALAAFGEAEPSRRAAPAGPLLAQSGDVEIFFDDRGNRIILDSRTGEVIAVEPPRRVLRAPAERRAQRRRELREEVPVLNEEFLGDEEVEIYEERRGNERVIVIAPKDSSPAEQGAAARRRAEERREAERARQQEEQRAAERRREREERRQAERQREQEEQRAAEREREDEQRAAERRREREERRQAERERAEEEEQQQAEREIEREPLDDVLTAQPPKRKPAQEETAAVAPDADEPSVVTPEEKPVVRRAPREPGRVRTVPLEQEPLDGGAVGAVPAEPGVEVAPPQPETEVAATAPDAAEPALEAPVPAGGVREEVAALQVLLDRVGASPGVIDGRFGSNVDKGIQAYNAITGQNLKSTDRDAIEAALQATGGPAFTEYTITPEDAAGPFVASVPADYGEKAKLERLGFTTVSEMLAERFHMDEAYLKALNPEANFTRPGTTIRVANVGAAKGGEVARIVADKTIKQVRAYDAAGKLVVAYPATIGSPDTPSPSGSHTVKRIAFNPEYTYNPKVNFKQGENDQILTIPPGPNGPVGSIWIALSKPTYGIHGTPEPSRIGKAESHGCVRLTNWDAAELAALVKEGVAVEFQE
jgi:lipoprotein-anchoring transpeptidase ErfK/SrfK